jgi:hypothetical protein
VSGVAAIPERTRVDELMLIVVAKYAPLPASPRARAFFNQSIVPFVILPRG